MQKMILPCMINTWWQTGRCQTTLPLLGLAQVGEWRLLLGQDFEIIALFLEKRDHTRDFYGWYMRSAQCCTNNSMLWELVSFPSGHQRTASHLHSVCSDLLLTLSPFCLFFFKPFNCFVLLWFLLWHSETVCCAEHAIFNSLCSSEK